MESLESELSKKVESISLTPNGHAVKRDELVSLRQEKLDRFSKEMEDSRRKLADLKFELGQSRRDVKIIKKKMEAVKKGSKDHIRLKGELKSRRHFIQSLPNQIRKE